MFTKDEGNRATVKKLKIFVAKELSEAARNYEPKFTQWG